MKNFLCWGIFREEAHSPNRVSDDSSILMAVGENLRIKQKFDVRLFSVSQLPKNPMELPDLIFLMCEEASILSLLEQWQARGVILINTPQSIRNTFRDQTLKLLNDSRFFPKTHMVHLKTDSISFPPFKKGWVKRGDYHAIFAEDVNGYESIDQFQHICQSFEQRQIEKIIIQEHVEGDLVKFYGVRNFYRSKSIWFEWFYHKDQKLKSYKINKFMLKKHCEKTAELMDVEVYGGDAIITEKGDIFIIDLNAWPSYALFRDHASNAIAQLISQKLKNSVKISS